VESDKYGREWHDDSFIGPPSSKHIPKGDQIARVQCQPPN
jgi:hypothetical protein